ncbi:hypothetical protein [Sorangium sp. So ce128]|uniref:hypothetical protein n=1 Tax=Sorangium sp. So ce128 TaxID=3133281 RepID=UPI003F63869F
MSYRVLVIPEDFRKDQYVLEPVITRMFEVIGRKAKVIVCRDPLLGGVDQALRWERLQEILVRYQAMIECFLLIVDRDGKPGRREALDRLESLASTALPLGKRFLAENAWQEVEVWLLAGHDLPSEWAWKAVRAHENPKEHYYQPLAKKRGVLQEPAEGPGILAREAASRYSRIRSLCPEVADLERRLGA